MNTSLLDARSKGPLLLAMVELKAGRVGVVLSQETIIWLSIMHTNVSRDPIDFSSSYS